MGITRLNSNSSGNYWERIATSTANTTYGAQIRELWSTYNNLSMAQKAHSMIRFEHEKFLHCYDWNDGMFTGFYLSGGTTTITTVRLDASASNNFYKYTIEGTAIATAVNLSTANCSEPMYLMLT